MVEMHWWVPGAITVWGFICWFTDVLKRNSKHQNRVLGFQVLTLAVLGTIPQGMAGGFD